jgi:hypothetical protein
LQMQIIFYFNFNGLAPQYSKPSRDRKVGHSTDD